jgi:hypothetical protein
MDMMSSCFFFVFVLERVRVALAQGRMQGGALSTWTSVAKLQMVTGSHEVTLSGTRKFRPENDKRAMPEHHPLRN